MKVVMWPYSGQGPLDRLVLLGPVRVHAGQGDSAGDRSWHHWWQQAPGRPFLGSQGAFTVHSGSTGGGC